MDFFYIFFIILIDITIMLCYNIFKVDDGGFRNGKYSSNV